MLEWGQGSHGGQQEVLPRLMNIGVVVATRALGTAVPSGRRRSREAEKRTLQGLT